MSTAREHLMLPRSREELYFTQIDPWDDLIVVLFNDDDFMPDPAPMLVDGVTRSAIAGIDRGEVVYFVLFLLHKAAPDYSGTQNAGTTCVRSEGGGVSVR